MQKPFRPDLSIVFRRALRALESDCNIDVAELAPNLLNVVGVAVGAIIGGAISLVTSWRNAKTQVSLQEAQFKREARAFRLSTIATLRDLVPYAEAAAMQAHYNSNLWEPSVATLLARARAPETVGGLSDTEWPLIADVASEASLAIVRLQNLSPNPFLHALDRRNADVDRDQEWYVSTIREAGYQLYRRLAAALGALGYEIPRLDPPNIVELVDAFRMRCDQRPTKVTMLDPDSASFYVKSQAG